MVIKMASIMLRNIRLINPASNTDEMVDILISKGEVAAIDLHAKSTIREIQADIVINGRGLIAAPGLVDVHVHFRDPGFTYKEDIHTGALAAAKGGYTSVVMMANTRPALDNPDTLSEVLDKASNEKIRIYSVGNVTKELKGKELTDASQLKEAGAVGLSDDGIPILDRGLLKEAFKKAAELDIPVSLHEEDPDFIENNGVNAGYASKKFGIGGSDRQAEIIMVERDLELALETGVKLDLQHISTAEAVELIRQAKKRGSNIHAEATPHHFTLTEDAVLTYGSLAKMNPPLRTEEDRVALIRGLKDKTIDIIATDHAPHSKEEKAKPLTEAPSGIIGLETALALGITGLVDKGYLTMTELIDRMSTAPARLYGFKAGEIKIGSPADIVIFDPNEEWIVSDFVSKSDNSPFKDWRLKGRVKYTICGGDIIYKDENII
ncbi:MAG: dihydroorotase [Lachnospiraceae bacterium]|nr:dihydroorotase [Lachnospiraceae bacterium]